MKKTQIESFGVLGITVRTTNENEQSSRDISALWAKFMSEEIAGQIPGKIEDTIYCVYTDYEKDFTKPYTTLLGCKVVSKPAVIPGGMSYREIAVGTYTQYTCKGNLSQGIVFDAWMEIWASTVQRKYTADFEVYG